MVSTGRQGLTGATAATHPPMGDGLWPHTPPEQRTMYTIYVTVLRTGRIVQQESGYTAARVALVRETLRSLYPERDGYEVSVGLTIG